MTHILSALVALFLNSASPSSPVGSASYLKGQTFMSAKEARTKWGNRPFVEERFRRGSSEERAAMVGKLVERKPYLGRTAGEVQKALGLFTGFFWSDFVPAYLIEEGWKNHKDTWQVVFLLSDEGKVVDIRVHKNCCPTKEARN